MFSRLSGHAPLVLSVLRIVTGLLFLEHGTTKLFDFPDGQMGPMDPLSWPAGIAGLFEIIGGSLIIVGLFTRPAAFLLSGQMAYAYWLSGFHFTADNIYPVNNGGDGAILFCFIFLYFVFAGGGSLSADSAMSKKSS